MEKQCKICGETFHHEKVSYLTCKFIKHLKEKHNLKDKIAVENGYYIYRVDEKSVKDINFLKKISEWENLN